MARFKRRLAQASEHRHRPEIVDSARAILTDTLGEEHRIDERFLQEIQTRLVTPTALGDQLRATLAALNVPLVSALTDIGYWPDMRWGLSEPASVFEVLKELAASTGIELELQQVQSTNAIVIRWS